MAREILFRGKRTDNGEWIEGTLYQIADDLNPFIMLKNRHAESHEVDANTVGQYTGLTDKNGKRIFEGDIAKYTNKDGTAVFYEVVWDNEFSALMFRLIGGWSGVFMAGMNERVEVIGNIHDNPELLNGTES